MRSLVTGAAGFVGRHLTRHLLSRGHEVGGLVHPSDAGVVLPDGVAVRSLDILDEDAIEKAFRELSPEAVYHLAAFANPEGSWREARRTLETNVIGAHNVLQAANATGKRPRVLLVGSAQQYGEVPEGEQPIREDRELQPLTPYAVSKTSQELLGQRSFRSGELPVFCTRSFNHTGPGQSDGYVCSSFARQVAEVEKGLREPVIRVGNLEALRDFSDVRDIVRGYWLALDGGCEPGEAYNLCSGKDYSIREVLTKLIELSGVHVEIKEDPSRLRPSDVPVLLGDASRFRKATGWTPRIPYERTLADMLDYWRAEID